MFETLRNLFAAKSCFCHDDEAVFKTKATSSDVEKRAIALANKMVDEFIEKFKNDFSEDYGLAYILRKKRLAELERDYKSIIKWQKTYDEYIVDMSKLPEETPETVLKLVP